MDIETLISKSVERKYEIAVGLLFTVKNSNDLQTRYLYQYIRFYNITNVKYGRRQLVQNTQSVRSNRFYFLHFELNVACTRSRGIIAFSTYNNKYVDTS